MQARGGGRIINITSISVKQPIEGLVLSNALRAAVTGLAKTLSVELAPHNILVNCVAPGYTRTDRVVELANADRRARGHHAPTRRSAGSWTGFRSDGWARPRSSPRSWRSWRRRPRRS